jgi:hypothetical protein
VEGHNKRRAINAAVSDKTLDVAHHAELVRPNGDGAVLGEVRDTPSERLPL